MIEESLTYADVLLQPGYSDIASRDEIEVESFYLGAKRLPIISAPMDFVTGPDMATTMFQEGAYGIINRFDDCETIPQAGAYSDFGLAIGAKNVESYFPKIESVFPHSVCIDVAHGHHKMVADAISTVKKQYSDIFVVAGNVATASGYLFLKDAGADAVRVGIGPGSACSTRENTGVGVPQLTAIMECAKVNDADVAIIADGGIQTPGDIVKALAAGADAVMLGNLLAGHDESPGDLVDGYKQYRGQSMLGSNAARNAPEGVSGRVPYRGTVRRTVEQLMNYLRSGMSYVGARNLSELDEKAVFVRISPGTFNESRTRI